MHCSEKTDRCLVIGAALLALLLAPVTRGESNPPDPAPVPTPAPAQPTGQPIVVHNGAEPAQGARRVQLAEAWRAGGSEDDVFFGVIVDVACDEEGRVYLLDGQLNQVFIYSADGRYLGTVSKEGEGPGEIRRPHDLMILPAGRLGIIHHVRGRITCLNPDGTPAPDILLRDAQGEAQNTLSLMNGTRRGPALALTSFTIVYGEESRKETHHLGVYDIEGRQRYEAYARDQRAFDFERRTYVERLGYDGAWTLGPDGSLYLAPERNAYRVEQRDLEGRVVRVIERDYVAHRRTADEKQQAAAGAVMTINGQQVPLACDIEDRDPCITQLHVDDAGGLWVLHSESRSRTEPERLVSYDRFDPAGRFLERVEILDPADPDQDQFIMLDPERFVVLRGITGARLARYGAQAEGSTAGGAEPLEVVYYRAVK